MLKEIGSVFSFLTIIPTGNSDLETVAKHMYLFPIVGIAIGLLVGSIGFGLSFFRSFNCKFVGSCFSYFDHWYSSY